ncbi:MAG: hypothetical protein ACHP7H_00890 [Hyphomicrobiales bacterium]
MGQRYKSRSARDHLSDLLTAAEAGVPSVITRDRPVATIDANLLEELLATRAPFDVLSSVTDDQVAFWLADGSAHAVGSDLGSATEGFLDALIDYAQSWYEDLRDAPNHVQNRWLALRIALHAGDRKELEYVVFGD